MVKDDTTDRLVLGAIALGVLVTLAFSAFVQGSILLWATFVYPLVFVYLLWRFVRAHERIAATLEE